MSRYDYNNLGPGIIPTDNDVLCGRGVNIAAHPQDWHMLQPLWLADLTEQRRAYLEGR